MKKNSLREQIRPIVHVPPSKAFPKELAMINKLLISEKQKIIEQKSKADAIDLGKNNKSSASKGKSLSKSVCIEVNKDI